jgi:outer membrane cobalamin receptor
VVQVFTRRGAATDGPRLTGSFEGGSFASTRGDVWMTGGAGDRIDYSAGLAARRTDGAFADRLPQDDRFRQTAVDGSVGVLLGTRASVRTGARFNDSNGRLVGQIGYGILNTGSTADTRDVNWHLNVSHTAGTRYAGAATVNYYRANNTLADTGTDATVNVYALLSGTRGAIFPQGPRLIRLLTASEYASLLTTSLPAGQFLVSTPFGWGDFPFTSRTQFRRPAFKYAGDVLWGNGQRLTVGYEWERESNALMSAQQLTNNAAFVQQQFAFGDRWFATVGARVDDKSMDDSFFSPKISAGGYLRPAGPGPLSSVKVFGNVGKGIKSPNFFERFGGSFADPSPDLKVERVRAMDAGVEFTLADQRVRATATVFDNRYRDQIEFRSTSPFFAPDGLPDYLNIAGSNARGLEFEGALQRPYRGVTATVTYAFVPTKVVETIDLDAQFRPGQPLLRRPKHSGAIRLDYTRGPLGAHWDTRIVGERHDSSFIGLMTPAFESAEISVNPGYTVSGLGLDFTVHRAATIYFRADNVFDEEYEGALGYPGTPRSAMVGLRFNIVGQ